MAIYRLSPSPNFGVGEVVYETWQDGFTPEECDRIIQYGESLSPQDSVVGLDEDSQEEVYDYFLEDAETDDITAAHDEFDGDYSENELRLMKIKFMSEMAN